MAKRIVCRVKSTAWVVIELEHQLRSLLCGAVTLKLSQCIQGGPKCRTDTEVEEGLLKKLAGNEVEKQMMAEGCRKRVDSVNKLELRESSRPGTHMWSDPMKHKGKYG